LPPEGYESVILKDLTGLDACGLVFLQKDKTFLEPTNINAFGIKLERENEYWIKFEKDNLHGSFCMVGDVINLLELKIPYKY
jgi:hypothetical protein